MGGDKNSKSGKKGIGKGAWDANGHAAWPAWGDQGMSPEDKRKAKKASRRAEQLAKVDAKGEAEAAYFWECKERCSREKKEAKPNEAELFGRQTTVAIDFSKYEGVEVTRSGPGAKQCQAT